MRISPAVAILLFASVPAHAVSLCKQPAPQAAAKTALFSTPPARKYSRLLLQASRARAYDAAITVPVLRASSPVARAANKAVRSWAQRELKDFVHTAITEGAGRSHDMPPYDLDTEPVRTFVTPRLVSLTMERYSYLGGAHGMQNRIVWRFGEIKGRVRPLNLGDFFTAPGYRKRVNDSIMKKLRAEPRADWVKPGTGDGIAPMVSTLTTSQLNDFAVQHDGLLWSFDPYAMGSYASGTIEVKLSLSELGPTFRRQWLKP